MRAIRFLLAMAAFGLACSQTLAVAAEGSAAKADEAFNKRRYQQALKEYDEVLKSSSKDYRSIFRAATCEAMLFRYAEAAQRLTGKALPQETHWRVRFLFLTAELGREFLKQYGHGLSDTVEEGTDDVTRKTPAQWRKEIRASFAELWKMRETLLGYKVSEEGDFIDIEKADVSLAPTLLDFLVLRWVGYLGAEEDTADEQGQKPEAMALLESHYGVEYSDKLPIGARVASILETASRMPARGRELASELWHLFRLQLPIENSAWYRYPESAEAIKAYDNRALAVFQGLFESFTKARSRGLAGYQAAMLLNQHQEFEKTVNLCRKVERVASGTPGGDQCAELRAGIELPRVELESYPVPPGGKHAFRVTARNSDEVFFRAYKTSVEELKKLAKVRNGGDRERDFHYLRWIEGPTLKTFLERDPARAWQLGFPPEKPYAYVKKFADFPDAEPGLYVIVASNEKAMKAGTSLLKGTISNVSKLFLLGSSGQAGLPSDQETTGEAKSHSLRFELYSVDGESGVPAANTSIDGVLWDYDFREKLSASTDAQGHAGFITEVRRDENSHSVDVLATKDRNLSFLASPMYAYYARPPRYELRLETDRPIYRPGQKVQIKLTGLERVPRGLHAYRGSRTINLRVMDANYQEIFKKEMKLDSFGVASVEVEIPAGRLLGSYSIAAYLPDGRDSYSAGAQFQVEEYKRPEFEVEVDPPKAPWRYGQKVSITGSAKYYFGGPVPDAPVSYRVYRQIYIPWFCWWWRGFNLDSGRKEVASGQAKTDAEGKYHFDFTPSPTENEAEADYPVTFAVEVDARDAGGRTLSANRDFRAGKHALLFNIPPPAGFYREKQSIELKPALVDLNEQPASAEGTYELKRIESEPKRDPEEWRYPGLRQEPSLELMFASVEGGASVRQGRLKFDGAKGAQLDLKGLPEGLYRAHFEAKDPWGGEVKSAIILVVVDPSHWRVKLPLPGVALTEHTSYAPGETAMVLLGSSRLSGAEYVEAWGGRFLLGHKTLSGGGPQLVDFEINDEWKGGAVVRWFGAGHFEIRGGLTELAVPWTDKELKTELAYGKVMKPGEKVEWSLLAKDPSGRGVDAEATFRVFDRSLEYYVKSLEPWVKSLYPRRGLEAGQNVSMSPTSITDIAIERGWIKKMLEEFHHRTKELVPPALLLNRTRVYARGGLGRRMREEAMGDVAAMDSESRSAPPLPESAPAPVMAPKASVAQAEFGGGKLQAQNKMLEKDKAPSGQPGGPPEVKARTNFSETAHFDPALKVSRGKASIKFTAPEQLTSWKLDASVLTADAKWGYASGEAVTRKDLMVRVEMPRFYRENDTGQVKAVVHNESDHKLTGKITLQVREGKTTGGTALEHLGLTGALERSFEAKPHAVVAFSWPVAPPAGVRDFKIRAIVRAGDLVDAEERLLPILPSRQRLIESQVVVLDGTVKKTLSVPAMRKQDASRKSELLEFRVDPQLALTVLNSLPFLVEYPFECTEQVLERYVPSAIVDAFYEKYPAIAEATKKLPKRDTVVPPWEKDDPRRMITLLETPWKQESEGGYRPLGLVDMLNPKVVRAQRDDALQLLKSYQLGNGGFPWFPGGQADPYMTLVVLGGFAEAERYGIDTPADVRDRALQYLFSELPQHLKPDEGNVSLILYGAYVTTSFDKSRQMTGQALELSKAWLDYALKHELAMTPIGHAYAAHALWRLGRDREGDDQLERALDGGREDEIAGYYWTPEKISWLWYSDTLEKHAFFLRTLLEKKPKDPRIAGMVKWIMFNRKGNEWKSTKAAAAAIYSLLDVMKKRGSLDKGDEYRVTWKPASVDETIKVGPTDWLAKPLRWEKRADAPANPTEAELPKVDKKGPGYAFASLTWIYSTEELPTEAVNVGLIGVTRKYFRRVKEGTEYHLKPMSSGDSLPVGDELEVHLTVTTKSQFEYVHLKDPKPAGFEAETLLSGWKWDQLGRYEEPRDSLMNFFMSWVPHGEYVLKYRMRATTAGSYRIGPAVLQSMYAPEMTGYSTGFKINVTGE